MDTSTHPDLYIDALPSEYTEEGCVSAPSAYQLSVEQLKRDIVAYSFDMPPTHVSVCKQLHSGRKTADVAAHLNITPATVHRVRKSVAGKRLLGLLARLGLLVEGVQKSERRHCLWRIAEAHEKTDPRVSISAIAEINKMAHNDAMLQAGFNGGQTVEIVINNTALPRGALD